MRGAETGDGTSQFPHSLHNIPDFCDATVVIELVVEPKRSLFVSKFVVRIESSIEDTSFNGYENSDECCSNVLCPYHLG